ncbi:high-affinity nitrate transporter -like [Micractinium conductrix]|uniref:High-affinity nitrate transporter -like n=1 Tax=Micractinium conductrix TaxID=554055 RepID=A0A2P6VCB1_9CHLO|nr:high-affinity nitrate transporter -like [Micractinium conductrix]|eukprot:PSC71714.1 high-affinity nitrate transporter -like [Micractinium conductrix]
MRAACLLALLGLCGLAAASGVSKSTQNYTSLQPPAYTITLSYIINGVTGEPIPCNYTNSACLPLVEVTEKDSIIINYSGPAGTPGNTVSLMQCFAPPYSKDRAWRKANAVIAKDNQCNQKKPFAKALPTGSGSFTWTPSVNVAPSVYTIQLLEVQANTNPVMYAAMGKGTGYFQIIPINSRPAWLMAMTGVFCAIGPCVLAGYFYFEKVHKRD